MKRTRLNSQHLLRRIAKSRFALSTVVTTLIILVVSVLLAGVVTYFAINVTSTRVQEESLALTKQHVWYDSVNSFAEGVVMVINTGGRDVAIDKITVRGQECAWSKVFYYTTTDTISSDLYFNSTLVDGGAVSIQGVSCVFNQASGALTLQSGKTMIIYLANPDSVSVHDVGLVVSINVFTAESMYYKENNVEGVSGSAASSSSSSLSASPTPSPTGTPEPVSDAEYELVLIYANVYNVFYGDEQVGMVLKNNGTSDITITTTSLIYKGASSHGDSLMAYVGVFTPTQDVPEYKGIDIQGYTLQPTDTIIVKSGESAIVYFIGVSDVIEWEGSVEVGLSYGNGQTVTRQAQVQEVTY
jgi:hypothetical protein